MDGVNRSIRFGTDVLSNKQKRNKKSKKPLVITLLFLNIFAFMYYFSLDSRQYDNGYEDNLPLRFSRVDKSRLPYSPTEPLEEEKPLPYKKGDVVTYYYDDRLKFIKADVLSVKGEELQLKYHMDGEIQVVTYDKKRFKDK